MLPEIYENANFITLLPAQDISTKDTLLVMLDW